MAECARNHEGKVKEETAKENYTLDNLVSWASEQCTEIHRR